jgi:hypothetical protein
VLGDGGKPGGAKQRQESHCRLAAEDFAVRQQVSSGRSRRASCPAIAAASKAPSVLPSNMTSGGATGVRLATAARCAASDTPFGIRRRGHAGLPSGGARHLQNEVLTNRLKESRILVALVTQDDLRSP